MKSKKLKRLLAAFAAAAMAMTSLVVPVSAEADLEISTAAELAAFRDAVNSGTTYQGQTVVLADDIDLSDYDWTSIGTKDKPFKGTFNGQERTISNLSLTSTSTFDYIGLFGYVDSSGTVNNLTVNGTVTANSNKWATAGIIGHLNGKADNLTNYCTVNGIGKTSGVAGYLSSAAALTNSKNYGTIVNIQTDQDSNEAYAGGVIGWSNSNSISGLENHGTVTGVGGYIGGVAGKVSSISDSVNYGTVTCSGTISSGVMLLGGITGFVNETATNLTNNGKIVVGEGASISILGGVVGNIYKDAVNLVNNGEFNIANAAKTGTVGGAIGQMVSIGGAEKIVNTQDITANASYVSGVIGSAGESIGPINNCYNTGNITNTNEATDSTNYAAGIIGHILKGTISDCYSYGTIQGLNAAGIAGWVAKDSGNSAMWNEITNSYYLAQDGVSIYAKLGEKQDSQGTIEATAATKEQFASGEVAYLLKHDSQGVWGQEIGTDDYPVLDAEHEVFMALFIKEADAEGTLVDELTADNGKIYQIYKYTNDKGDVRYYSRYVDGVAATCYYDDTYYTEEDYNSDDSYLKADVKSGYENIYNTMKVINIEPQIIANSYANSDGGFTVPEDPTKNGYTFKYWSETENGTKYDVSTEAVKDVTLYAVFESLPIIKSSHSLTTKGEVAVNFFVEIPEEYETADQSDITIKFTWDNGSSEVNFTDAVETTNTEKTQTGADYKVGCPVPAKEMADTITAKLYVGDELIDTQNYSVAGYAELAFANGSDAIKPFAKSMLIYGASAQEYFGYNTENLASKNLSDTELNYSIPSEGLEDIDYSAYDFSAYGLEYYASSLILKADTTYRIYFKVTDETKLAEFEDGIEGKVTLTTIDPTLGECSAEWAHGMNGVYKYFDITNIPAKNITDTFRLTFDGVSFDFNAKTYMNKALTQGSESLQNTVRALYNYNQNAIDYFTYLKNNGTGN